VVLDVGGGTGHYATWLAARGYTVHLVGPVPLHLELARARSAAQAHAPLASIVQGDARRLEWQPNTVDAMLLLGPLYHLIAVADRLECLREAWRVLRPESRLIAVLSSRFASTPDGLEVTCSKIRVLHRLPGKILRADCIGASAKSTSPRRICTIPTKSNASSPRPALATFNFWRLKGLAGSCRTSKPSGQTPDRAQCILEAVRRTEGERTLLGVQQSPDGDRSQVSNDTLTSLYAFCGLPFAGKSTAAKALSERTGWPIVQLDAINAEYGVGLNGSSIALEDWQRTYAEAYRRLANCLADGQTVIFDHGNFSRRERDAVRETARAAGANVRFIYVRISVHEARQRLLRNRETHDRHDVRDDNFEQALEMFHPPDHEADVLDFGECSSEPDERNPNAMGAADGWIARLTDCVRA
jgi:predicted kinase